MQTPAVSNVPQKVQSKNFAGKHAESRGNVTMNGNIFTQASTFGALLNGTFLTEASRMLKADGSVKRKEEKKTTES